jgi:CHAT domain-containing protein/Tfp pilus assembly protein PilF
MQLALSCSSAAPDREAPPLVSHRSATTARDITRIAGEQAFADGERLQMEANAESNLKAIKKYEEALFQWRAAGEKLEEARTLKNIGEIHYLLGDPRKAAGYYEDALRLSQEAHDLKLESAILNDASAVHLLLGDRRRAKDYCARSLNLSQTVRHRPEEARALNNLGEVYYASGNLHEALVYYQKALPIWQSLEDHRGEAQTILYCGYVYSDLSETKKAFDHYNQAILLWRMANDRRGQALTLIALAHLHSKLGEKQKAIDLYDQAKPLIKIAGDRIGESAILMGEGFVYLSLGDEERTLDYYNQALRIFQDINFSRQEAGALVSIGSVYYSIGDNQKALTNFQQALSVIRNLSDRVFESFALRNIGAVYNSLGNKNRAIHYYNRALFLCRASKHRQGEAETLNHIGAAYRSSGEKNKALDYFNRALLLNRAIGNRFAEASTAYNIAQVELDRGNPAKARFYIDTAFEIVEMLRANVSSHKLRATYFASIQQYFEFYIHLLMFQHSRRPSAGFADLALEQSERARARSLLEQLIETRADFLRWGAPSLVERLRKLQQQINANAEFKAQMISANAAEADVLAITKEIISLINEREQVEAQIRAQKPPDASSAQPQPASLKEIQQLLDDDTLLLEYALGGERSYLWAVTPNGLKSYELPGRADIEMVARSVYDLLAPPQFSSPQPEKQREAEYWRQASALSRMLLKPVADQLGSKRLLIVADGVLQYIPFAALPIPDRERGGDKRTREIRNPQSAIHNPQVVPLIVEHEIVNLPSASTLAVLRRETAGRRPAPKAVAALADPVFETDDMRVLAATGKVKGAADKQANNQLTANLPIPSARLRGMRRDGGFWRLPATLNEARAIEEVTIESERLIAKGFDASRARATDPTLSQYRIIHFATHGILDRNNPELSAIVLSLIDRQGRPQDGYLRLHDIYNLNLPAELVVLSACDTGLGKEFKGEGLIGLTRGFMYAGAARVMASLWKVEDEPTAKLMRHFYRHMMKSGMPPAAALRQAQIALWQDAEWRAPYFWAAFIIQGEWR